LQELRLVSGRRHLAADTADYGFWIKGRRAQIRILMRRLGEGGGEYSLIAERPRRRVGREEDVLDDGRQRHARIKQLRCHAFRRSGFRPSTVIWPSLRLARGGPHIQAMAVVIAPNKRQSEVKRSQVEAKGRGWRRGENSGNECGNPKNNADLSHDLAP
jgi:hypothetical protein